MGLFFSLFIFTMSGTILPEISGFEAGTETMPMNGRTLGTDQRSVILYILRDLLLRAVTKLLAELKRD